MILIKDAFACDKPFTLRVGPEFSSSFMVDYLGAFTLSVAQKVGCGTRIKGSKNYDEFLSDILNQESDIFLVPSHFAWQLSQEGFIPVLERQSTTELIYISSIRNIKHSPYGKQQLLHVYTPGPYLVDYLSISNWLQEQQATNIEHSFGHTYASAIMKAIKNPNVITSIPLGLLERLPQNIQNKLTVTHTGFKLGGYLLVKANTSKAVIDAIHSSIGELKSEEWIRTNVVQRSEFSQAFQEQYKQLKESRK